MTKPSRAGEGGSMLRGARDRRDREAVEPAAIAKVVRRVLRRRARAVPPDLFSKAPGLILEGIATRSQTTVARRT